MGGGSSPASKGASASSLSPHSNSPAAMARSRSFVAPLALLALGAVMANLCLAPTFVAPPRATEPAIDVRMAAATFAGLSPLALEQPAGAYDSVMAMLQSWLVAGSVLLLIFAAVLVAATANPLTKRRQEVANMVRGGTK